MTMDENDFTQLISSFLKNDSDAQPEIDHAVVEEIEGKSVEGRKTILESLLEKAEQNQSFVSDEIVEETGEILPTSSKTLSQTAEAEDEAAALADRLVDLLEQVDEQVEAHVQEEEIAPAFEETLGKEDIVLDQELAKLEVREESVAENDKPEEIQEGLSVCVDLQAGELTTGFGLPEEEPSSFKQMVDELSLEFAGSTVVVATTDGLVVASAGAEDADALAAGIPGLMRESVLLGERLGVNETPLFLFEYGPVSLCIADIGQGLALAVAARKPVSIGLVRWSVKRHLSKLDDIV